MEREGSLVPVEPARVHRLVPERYPDRFFQETATRVEFAIQNLLGRHRGAAEFLRDLRQRLEAVPEARA